MVILNHLNASSFQGSLSHSASPLISLADLSYSMVNNNNIVVDEVVGNLSSGAEGGAGGAVYVAPTWVFNLTAVALFFIGVLGITSNFLTIVVYVFDKSVSGFFYAKCFREKCFVCLAIDINVSSLLI